MRRVSRYARKSHHWKELEENVKSELARRDGKMVHGSWAQRLRLNVPLLQFGLTLFGKGKSKARPFIVSVSVQDRSASCQVQSLELADAPQDLVPPADVAGAAGEEARHHLGLGWCAGSLEPAWAPARDDARVVARRSRHAGVVR